MNRLIFLYLTFITLNIFAQAPDGRALHYTLKDGLSFDIVNSIAQDNKSFLWFATGDGLNRFDGAGFKIFKYDSDDKFSLPGNFVQTIFEDSKGVMWVSSRRGLNEFDPKTERFYTYKFTHSAARNDVTNIAESGDGNLWISYYGDGISYFDKKNKKFVNYTTENLKGLSSNAVLNAVEDPFGWLWVGTKDAGVNVFKVSNGKLLESVNFNNHLISSGRINCIYNDHLNNIWIATANGLIFYDRKSNKFHTLPGSRYHLKSNFFLSLAENSHRQLFVGLQDGGLYKLDMNKFGGVEPDDFVFEHVKDENGNNITQRSVQVLYLDKDENLWAGTYGDGVYMVNHSQEKFREFHKKLVDPYGESYLRYYGMCLDNEGYLWLGTDGDGIYKTTINGETVKHYKADGKRGSLTDNAILYAFKDRKNNLWFGTYSKGLFLYNRGSDSFINFQHDPKDKNSIGANDVRTIYEDDQQNIWIGTNGGGLSLLDPVTKKFRNYNSSNSNISANDVRSVVHDKKGNLWVGTYGGGLNYFITRQHRFYRFFEKKEDDLNLPSDVIFSLYLDKNERLWIGTEGDGLMLYHTLNKSKKKFSKKNGLANNTIYAIQAESDDKIWVSTNEGLSKIDLRADKIYNYNESDGLQGGQFNAGSAIVSEEKRLMCFGGTQGWNIFYPWQVKQSKDKPEIRITGLQLYGKEEGDNGDIKNISEAKEIVIEANQSVFSIQYTALNYAYPKAGQFAYKLEGLDQDWNYVKSQRSATYRYLDPGTYIFKVKATNQDNIWNSGYASVRVKVLPPWYKSWWAYCMCASVCGYVVYIFIGYKSKQAKLKYEIKIAHIEAEKEKEIHENKLSFFTNISHEFRTPLTLIINPVKEILYDKEKNSDISNLNIVYRNAKRLLSLVDQLLLFRKAETETAKLKVVPLNLVSLGKEVFLCFTYQAAKKNISYEFICETEFIAVFGDREKIEIALFNLISNALRFTPVSGFVRLCMLEMEAEVKIGVSDNGPGIPKYIGDKIFERFYKVQDSHTSSKGGFGIGLYLVKSFIESHMGTISYTSVQGEGTNFEICLLKGKGHFEQVHIFEDDAESSLILDELQEEFEEIQDPATEPAGCRDRQNGLSSDTKTILIIDDNKQIRQYINQLFKSQYELLEADNGEEGLKMVQLYLPDLIITDVMMSGLNGIELCSRIKEDPSLNHIPVILLTASTSPEIKLKGIECGADDYISKPFEKELLMARVAGILKSRNDLQKYFYNEITLKSGNLKISAEYKEFLDRCIKIVEKHITDPNFGIKTLAEEIGMSRSNLYIRVKSISGQSANSFIRFIRLRKAAEIFINTDATIQETTFKVGIKDPKYFREQFYKVFHMNPSDYIKKYRKTFQNKYTLDKALTRSKQL